MEHYNSIIMFHLSNSTYLTVKRFLFVLELECPGYKLRLKRIGCYDEAAHGQRALPDQVSITKLLFVYESKE